MYGQNTYSAVVTAFTTGTFTGIGGVLAILLIVWSLVWKGFAVWKAAHKEKKIWFWVLLVVNTFGILDILYIYIFSKKKKEDVAGNP